MNNFIGTKLAVLLLDKPAVALVEKNTYECVYISYRKVPELPW